ncbi:MAG: RIP metalloprotease RseP [Actinobacteria bacterium]|nr:RIP metalloprotease RseP [Actinomycetota bacterium]
MLGVAILILAHEFGHFLIARIFRIRVEEFVIGLPGPKIIKFKKGDTVYGISAIPFGGYVRLYGEFEDPNDPNLSQNPESFIHKPWYVQALVVAAGAFFNFLIAILIFAIMFVYGVPGYPTTTIDKVIPQSPAEKAGIQPGDKILRIDSMKVREWQDISDFVSKNPNRQVELIIKRNDKEIRIRATIGEKNNKGFLGVQSKTTVKRLSPFSALLESTKLTAGMLVTFVKLLFSEAFKGDLLKQSTGPVGIVVETSRAVKVGFDFYLFLIGLISINLGLVNLLPIPPLDGGRIVIIFLERAIKKKIPQNALALIQLFGILLFAYLMIYLLISDIQRYFHLNF